MTDSPQLFKTQCAENVPVSRPVVIQQSSNDFRRITCRPGAEPDSSFRAVPDGRAAVHPAGGSVAEASALRRPGAPLGTTAKSSSPCPTGGEDGKGRKAHRALKYQALSQGRQWLVAQAKAEKPAAFPGDVYRTADCRHVNHGLVGVNLSPEHKAAHYSGLATCGSVWACPVCASRIQERRRPEVQQAIDWATEQGYVAVMVTFTFPHKAWNRLDELLSRQADAFKRLRSGKRWQNLKGALGFQGLIRSLEVTHGQNGWHPHTHELWFLKGSPEGLQDLLSGFWLSACSKAGLVDANDSKMVEAFMAHGVDVKEDVTCGDYLAKQDDSRRWGFAEEISKATSKAGRAKGVHPHHFLVRRAEGDRDRYVEYVQSMKGRRQLFWSHGLKAVVGINEISDEELADESREPAELLGRLTPEDWKVVRGNDARAELLDAAEQGGWPAVKLLLEALRL